jgi:Uma2 family endonuclease
VVRIQNPIRLGDYSEPQPDAAVARPRESGYARSLPNASDVVLVLEVSDATLVFDRNVKLPMYAGAEIPEAWIIDVNGEMLERYTEPGGDVYATVARAGRGEALESTVVPGLILRTDEIINP